MRALSFGFDVAGVAAGALWVSGFEVREALSEGRRVEVTTQSHVAFDVDALVGARATLRVERGDGTERRFHGVVVEASLDAPRADRFVGRFVVVAGVDLLKLGRDRRIFQTASVPDIVTEVLGDVAHAWHTASSYDPRGYVVQHDESDFAFVSRLLAEEGIGFRVHDGEDREEVVFFDDDHDLLPIDGDATLTERDALRASEDVVEELGDARALAPDAVVLRDYDYTRPTLDLTATERAPASAAREVYDHPGGFLDLAPGRRLAKRALERLRVATRAMAGRSDCARLAPGRTFTVEGHPRAEMDVPHLVVSVTHRGAATRDERAAERTYENDFVAMPKTVPYRPARPADADPAPGVGVAFVTTPPGEEIHTDEWGRVKVRFPWDRSGITDDGASTWLRVGQVALGGAMLLPRGGFEVLVDHERGDVDRPMVAAQLYNGERRPPYDLPAHAARTALQSATTPGGAGANELRFDDTAGAEELFMNASRDMTVSVDRDARANVTHDERVAIGANRKLSVGTDHTATVAANRSLTVGASQSVDVGGDDSDAVGGAATTTIGATRRVQCGGDHSENTAGSLARTVGALQCVTAIAGYQRSVVGSSTTTVGAAWLEVAGTSRASDVGGSRTETVGALKLIKATQCAVSAGAAYVQNAGAESVKCGGSRVDAAKGALAVSAGGGLSVKAANINIEAKNRLVVVAGGCVIKLSSSGAVSVRAAKVSLKGAKALGQVMHRSN